MLMSQVGQFKYSPAFLALRNSSNLSKDKPTSILFPSKPSPRHVRARPAIKEHVEVEVLPANGTIPDAFPSVETFKLAKPVTVNVEVNVKDPTWLSLKSQNRDTFDDTLDLALVSSKAKTGSEGHIIKGVAKKKNERFDWILKFGEATYEWSVILPASFGELGAVMLENGHKQELYLDTIVIDGFRSGKVTISCKSWVHSKDDNPKMRVFFTNKSYLPSKTPTGLKELREKELENLRGNGEGERKASDRIYDYDKYNDLGDPDKDVNLLRPVLGGNAQYPYPRRCRTGRGPSKEDPLSEKHLKDELTNMYVPRDEQFSLVKNGAFYLPFILQALRSFVAENEIPGVPEDGFPNFTTIDSLYNDGLPIPDSIKHYLEEIGLDNIAEIIYKGGKCLLRFPPPDMFKRDRFSWLRDDEFSRQTLAGVNPFSIQLVTKWPLESKLDPNFKSSITKEIVEREIGGIMTCDEAMEKKRLFMLDYHDLLLPYVQLVRELEDTTLYASRTLFFLQEDGTLKPIAIELYCPPIENEEEYQEVFTPSPDATSSWLWMFAKAHVNAHDSAYHQLVVHWLRTHCCMEPYIIAANRQLSAMHPIYRLLHPHFRYTMFINAMARKLLISADGVVEKTFSPGKYSMEISSAAYKQLWRFDMEAVPADLIRRGMAVEDPEHGLKLTIEDYPFANDALLLWDNIKSWVTDYVNHYYRDAKTIEDDTELQAWWNEVRTKGHEDKKDEPWWPVLNTKDSLIQTLSTIIWTASGHHAAVNFGQYGYAGYFPNRPTIARIEMPTRPELLENPPEEKFLKCLPTKHQATQVMTVMYTLSNHSPEEEYIGKEVEPSWSEEPAINEAFKKFQNKIQMMEAEINARNTNEKLKNRVGAGIAPYELLKPNSTSFGVTGMGVANSISI